MDFSSTERPFFEHVARQLGVAVSELMTGVEARAADPGYVDMPCIVLDDDGRVRTLDCVQTPLEVLDVSTLRELEELRCGWDDNLHHCEGSLGPRLTQLVLGHHPKLRELVARNWLRPRTPAGPKIATLDVSGAPALDRILVDNCDLRELDVSANTALAILDCSGNPLESLRLGAHSRLEYLDVSDAKLERLDLSNLAALETVHAGGKTLQAVDFTGADNVRRIRLEKARIASLDLAHLSDLESLSLRGCGRLTALDLRHNPRLREVAISNCRTLKSIECTEFQRQTIVGLRKFFKLSKPTKDPAKMDPFMLHAFVRNHNWDEGTSRLFKAVRNPSCSLASVLLVYWLAKPHWYLQWEDDKTAVAEHACARRDLELIREIERRVEDGEYEHHPHIPWSFEAWMDDPYPDRAKLRSIPEHILAVSAEPNP